MVAELTAQAYRVDVTELIAASNGLDAQAPVLTDTQLRIVSRRLAPAPSFSDGVFVNVPQRLLFLYRGGVLVRKYFPRTGEYDLRAFLNPTDLTPEEGVRFFHTRVKVPAGMHSFAVTFPASHALSEGPVPNAPGAGGAPRSSRSRRARSAC